MRQCGGRASLRTCLLSMGFSGLGCSKVYWAPVELVKDLLLL